MRHLFFIFFLFVTVQHAGAQRPDILFPGDFQTKTAQIPTTFTETEKPAVPSTVTVNVDFDQVVTPLSRYLFGNNANVFMTQMVDQPTLLNQIEKLTPNILRFPGGNLSSVFFWNAEPAQAPADAPAKLADANGNAIDPGYWYGRNTQSWTLSVDNYYSMLESTNSTGIITVNYGYARYGTAPDPVAVAAHLAAEWVRYDNGRTRFWEIGNESNGSWQAGFRIKVSDNKDGQPEIVNGELYGNHFKVFADSMRKAASEKGNDIYIGAQLLAEAPASWWNATDRSWNSGVFTSAGDDPDFYIIHSYYTPYQTNSTAQAILNSATTVTPAMINYVRTSITGAGLPQKPVALTEWNIFAEGSKQQVSFISGMHAAIVMGELIRHGYALACRWDLANGWSDGNDHGMFSQGDQPGVPKWHPRPVYYYQYFFQKYFGDQMLASSTTGNADVLAYTSKFTSGEVGLVIVNKGSAEQTVAVNINGFGFGDRYYYHSLTGGTDNGSFSLKVFVNGLGPTLAAGGPPDLDVPARAVNIGAGIKVTSPPRSVQYILVEKGDNIITGTEEAVRTTLEAFPNPAHKKLTISLPAQGFEKLAIHDLRGAKAYERNIAAEQTSVEIDVSLTAGTYVLTLYKGKIFFQKKIIIY
jgi:hypothetical protein